VAIDPRSDVPPSRQLVEAFLDAVARGDLGPGAKLPSVRGLAEEALVNPNTVGKAYRELEVLGVVEGRNGSGVYVTDGGPTRARRERGRATLEALTRAAREALRAGHDVDAIERAVTEALGETTREATPATAAGREVLR
jgi:GntR family transcriptional regulator